MALGWWRSGSTRVRRANATASSTRAVKWNAVAAARNADHWAWGSITSTSTSWVRRGRPRSDAATPPMIRPRTSPAWSHAMRSRRAASNGARGSDSAIVGQSELAPALTGRGSLDRDRRGPSQRLGRGHERSDLAEFMLRRYRPQLPKLSGPCGPPVGHISLHLDAGESLPRHLAPFRVKMPPRPLLRARGEGISERQPPRRSLALYRTSHSAMFQVTAARGLVSPFTPVTPSRKIVTTIRKNIGTTGTSSV